MDKFGGADHVIEIGGAGTMRQAFKALKQHGSLAVIGLLEGVQASWRLLSCAVCAYPRPAGCERGAKRDER